MPLSDSRTPHPAPAPRTPHPAPRTSADLRLGSPYCTAAVWTPCGHRVDTMWTVNGHQWTGYVPPPVPVPLPPPEVRLSTVSRLSVWLVVCLPVSLSGWLSGCLTGCPAHDWLYVWLADCLPTRLAGCLGCLILSAGSSSFTVCRSAD